MALHHPPYKSHPLYVFRVATIWSSIIGIPLTLLSANWDPAPWHENRLAFMILSAVFLFVSLLYCIHDLCAYAASREQQQHNNPTPIATASPNHTTSLQTPQRDDDDPNPEWPSKRQILIDFALAIIFIIIFIGEISDPEPTYDAIRPIIQAYAFLPTLVSGVLHAIVCWKELLARKHQSWVRRFRVQPCENCGHVHQQQQQHSTPAQGDATQQAASPASPRQQPPPRQPPSQTAQPDDNQSHRSLFSIMNNGGKIQLPKWARAQHMELYTDEEQGLLNNGHNCQYGTAGSPLITPASSSTTERAGEGSGTQPYNGLEQSVQSVDSVESAPETVVRKKDKGKKRVVDV